ncbi:DUF3631 domain-containing protein [Streptomyces sp. NPDC051569]|uniref:DUF3631 domain-containing protein n=1 Tax=Streptomyces sp. NPDC051569 TaxID=3365661 RepID=UPI0037B5C368
MTDPQPSTPSLPDDTAAPSWPPVAVPGQPAESTAPPADEDLGDASKAVPASEGPQILEDLRAQIKRYVAMSSEEAVTAVTLWVAATHLQGAWQHAPRLAIVAPEKRCGKSRLLDVVTETVHKRLITVNASAAAIFRSIDGDDPPTLLVDEADTMFSTGKAAEKNEEVRGLINAGHQRGRPTLRVSGPEHDVQEFATFAMAALAGIGDLPDTIMDRAVVIRMRRRAASERVVSFRTGRDTPALHAIRERLRAWLHPLHAQALEMEPPMPVEDRAADTWEPLVAVADLAGGNWPVRAPSACRSMTDYETGQNQEGDLRSRLLVDIRSAFMAIGDPALLSTRQLLEALNADKEGPWAEYKGSDKGLTPRHLQLLLKPYGINATNRRFPGGAQARGYARTQFLDTWARYCPEPGPAAEPAPAAGEPLPNTAA